MLKEKYIHYEEGGICINIYFSHKEVTIHGLGGMLPRAISMALAAQKALENQVILKPTTETITLIDDIIPDDMVKRSKKKGGYIRFVPKKKRQ